MKYSILKILSVFLLTAVIVSCDKERVLSPGPTNTGSPTPQQANNPYSDLSPVSSTDRVFYFFNSYTYPIKCNYTYCTIRSRYILHNNGGFLLQYNYEGGNEYRIGIQYKGTYTETNNSISLLWGMLSSAAGILRGDTLKVAYNEMMHQSDFEDAVYLLKR